jgi:hypothetical protein
MEARDGKSRWFGVVGVVGPWCEETVVAEVVVEVMDTIVTVGTNSW